MIEDDCLFPECLMKVSTFGRFCEHSCPYEEKKRKANLKKLAQKLADSDSPYYDP